MSRALNDLSDRFRPIAFELLARCVEQRIHVIVIDTLRTPEEQEENIRRGVSWTKNSKHLTGDAIDVAPVEVLNLKNWGPNAQVWQKLGVIGEALGLRWGGRWQNKDMCHFEFQEE